MPGVEYHANALSALLRGDAEGVFGNEFLWITTAAQMGMGFILPFALTFVAIPLESFVHALRTVLGLLLAGALRGLAAVLRRHAPGLLVAQANDSVYALAAGVWSRDFKRAWRVGRAVQAGTQRGLAAAGYAEDPRAERAYEWLLGQRLDDGAWPTGRASGAS